MVEDKDVVVLSDEELENVVGGNIDLSLVVDRLRSIAPDNSIVKKIISAYTKSAYNVLSGLLAELASAFPLIFNEIRSFLNL